MGSHAASQPGANLTDFQAAIMAQQPGVFPQNMAPQFNTPHQYQLQDTLQQLQQQHRQTSQGQMGSAAHARPNSATSHDGG